MNIETVNHNATGSAMIVNGETEVRYDEQSELGKAVRDWIATKGNKVGPAVLDLEVEKSKAVTKLDGVFAQDMTAAVGTISTEERDTWSAKEGAARAMIADPANVDPMLQAEADMTGESVDDLAISIVTKADAYRLIAGQTAGRKRRDVALVEAATTVEEVHTIVAAVVQQRIDEGV